MITALVILAAIVGGALIYVATLDGSYRVRRSLRMDVDRQTAYDKLRDYRTWPDWSPWLLHEPDAKLDFSDDCDQAGGWYSWDGRYIGAGKIEHLKLIEPERIEDRISFTRPFKSVASVWWELVDRDGQTEVSWNMQGGMPFLFRFMVPMVKQMIEKDYDLGLAQLRGQLDPQAERPLLAFPGETELPSSTALTIPFKGGLEAMKQAMDAGFPRLAEHVARHEGNLPGMPFSAYHKVNPKTKYFEADLAMPAGLDTPDGEFARKTLGGGKFYRVTLQGNYEFLELAWYAAMGHLRMLKIKMDKSRPSFEVYENDPRAVTNGNEIQTSLYIPVK